MKKVFTMILSGIMVFSITIGNVMASNENPAIQYTENTINNPYLELNEIIPVINEKSIELKGTTNPLYWEFKNFDNAIDIMKSYNQDKIDLSELTIHNCEKYAEEFEKLYTIDEVAQDKQLKILSQFFTVCRNHIMNKEILSLYNQKDY